MNILYCGNEKMADGLLISILSLLRNTKQTLNIYIMTAFIQTNEKNYYPLSEATVNFLDSEVKQANPANSVTRLDLTELFKQQAPTANMETIFTPYCMLRLFADLCPSLPDKILYLDTDVICRKDFKAFYDQDLTEHEVVGVADYYGKWVFKHKKGHFSYMNSGVLLMNLALIKQTQLLRRCRDLCRTKKMFMPDQTAINKLAGTKKIVPRRYNEQRRLHRNTVFQHFTTSFRLFPWIHTLTVKPWDVEAVHDKLKLYEYDDVLSEYQDLKPQMEALKS